MNAPVIRKLAEAVDTVRDDLAAADTPERCFDKLADAALMLRQAADELDDRDERYPARHGAGVNAGVELLAAAGADRPHRSRHGRPVL